MRYLLFLILTVALGLSANAALAHKSSDAFLYIDLDQQEKVARLDLAVVDLARAFPLDTDNDGRITWGELTDSMPNLAERLSLEIAFTRGGVACALSWQAQGLSRHSDGAYLSLRLVPGCPADAEGRDRLDYHLFFEQDPLHRLLVMTRQNDREQLQAVGPNQTRLAMDSPPSAWETARSFMWEGMLHLWIGYDHMLFLLALVLPAAVRREKGRWVVEDRLGTAVKDVVMIVTAFTIAHSITLVIATLGMVQLPIEWVETVIALSIVAAAINVFRPFMGQRRYLMGFAFGLIHGFGFASVLSGFIAGSAERALALASFNVGVELAQLAVVLLAVPLIFLVRKQWLYHHVALPSGVAAIGATGLFWVVERMPL